VSGKPGKRPPERRSIANRKPATAIEAAIEDVVRLTLELTSAIGQLAYADAVHARNELERALLRAQGIAESLPGGSKRALALRRVHEIREVAARELASAPASSSAAIEAAEAGDKVPWSREVRAWIVSRLASRSSTRGPRRRAHRDTRPDAPKALRETFSKAGDAAAAIPATALGTSGEVGDAAAAIPTTALGPHPSPDPVAGKVGTR
jgi:hypothetical protein